MEGGFSENGGLSEKPPSINRIYRVMFIYAGWQIELYFNKPELTKLFVIIVSDEYRGGTLFVT